MFEYSPALHREVYSMGFHFVLHYLINVHFYDDLLSYNLKQNGIPLSTLLYTQCFVLA
jgi:hypothetical protein